MRKVVFVTSLGHSGSTLLSLILASHPDAFGLGSFHNIQKRLSQHTNSALKLCDACQGGCLFWEAPAHLAVLRRYFHRNGRLGRLAAYLHHFHKSIYEHLFEWTDKTILIDSSKPLRWLQRQLRPRRHWRQMTPVLVYVSRDGRAVVNSLLRKYPAAGIEQIGLSWNRRATALHAFFEGFSDGPKVHVTYETFATEPGETIGALCRILGKEYFPSMVEYWKHVHHPIGGHGGVYEVLRRSQLTGANPPSSQEHDNQESSKQELHIRLDLRWEDELSNENISVFEALAGQTNRLIGYG